MSRKKADGKNPKISLGKRLRNCPSFRCLGVKANWSDYSDDAKEAIRQADTIHYPSTLYEDLFLSLGKDVFPRNYYRFMGNKIRQTALFQWLGIPHPRTRLYYGSHRSKRILEDFSYPFIAKTPVGSSQGAGVWLMESDEGLTAYLDHHRPAYIQEYLPMDRDLRVVVIAGKVVHAYWRIGKPGDFRTNVTRGASISYEEIPDEALAFAADVAVRCRFDEVGLDICCSGGKYYVIEANMVFGLKGFRQAGLDLHQILAQLDTEGII